MRYFLILLSITILYNFYVPAAGGAAAGDEMTAALVSMPPAPKRDPLKWGDIINGWCSKCGHPTEHVYMPGVNETCLVCHPELKEKVKDAS